MSKTAARLEVGVWLAIVISCSYMLITMLVNAGMFISDVEQKYRDAPYIGCESKVEGDRVTFTCGVPTDES